LQQGLFDSIVRIEGVGGDAARYVADGSDDVGRQRTDDVQVAQVASERYAGDDEFRFYVLKPGGRIVRPKWRQSHLCLKAWL
jgi:hypothetical protein